MIHKQAVRLALIVLLAAVLVTLLVGVVRANQGPCRDGFRFDVRYDINTRPSCARDTY